MQIDGPVVREDEVERPWFQLDKIKGGLVQEFL
jgi:hypothetical protein